MMSERRQSFAAFLRDDLRRLMIRSQQETTEMTTQRLNELVARNLRGAEKALAEKKELRKQAILQEIAELELELEEIEEE